MVGKGLQDCGSGKGGVRLTTLLGILATLSLWAMASIASAATAPAYESYTAWGDANLVPGGKGQFALHIHNVGGEPGAQNLKIVDEVPEGTTISEAIWPIEGASGPNYAEFFCKIPTARVLTCELPGGFLSTLGLAAPGVTNGFLNVHPTGWTYPFYVNVNVEPSAGGTGTNTLTIEGGGMASPHTETVEVPFGEAQPGFAIATQEEDVFDGAVPTHNVVRQAGSHPFEQRVNFEFTKRTGIDPEDGSRYAVANGTIKTVEVTLPRGAIGNPEALPKCDPLDFAEQGASNDSTGCPADTQVGYLNIHVTVGTHNYGRSPLIWNIPDNPLSRVAIYNMVPPKGKAADFAFNAGIFVTGHIYPELDPAQNYAIRTVSPEISSLVQPTGAEVVFWGVPGDPAHDKFRYYQENKHEDEAALGAKFEGAAIRPLLTNPMDCGFDNGGTRTRIESYQQPGVFSPAQEYPVALNVSGCEDPRIRFKPQVSLQPDSTDAGGPTGLDVHLEVPQRNDEAKEAKELYDQSGEAIAIATPPIKKTVVTFPEGMTLSPSAAQGLGTCTAEEFGLGTDSPVTCPDNSQYGKLILHTPILPKTAQPEGFIYIAKQGDNPFHNFLSMYFVIQEPDRGILVKIPGRIDLDPNTGQITATLDDLPQFPVSDMELRFKGGVRAGLVNPSTCGTKTIRAEFFSWADPTTPHVVDSNYQITHKPDGSPCVNSLADRQFKPQMKAGTESPIAGSYSPFAFRLMRTDDDQEFSQVAAKLPMGLAAKFAGVSICSDAGVAQALSRETVAGDGALEQADPSCPASSQIGTTTVGTGVGVPLSWVPGKVYLAGPYKGAPMSMVVISPAIVGPYDLGVITVRTALDVNPETAQGEAFSDPFPLIFQGIPVRIRDIRLNLDRPDFTLNPTSCAEKQITAHVTGTGGDLASTADDTGADLSRRFQAADCASLGFAPKLAIRLFGGTHRGTHPKLEATLRMPGAGANIAGASVALPSSEFLDQGHLNNLCTRVQFRAKECPAASVYGFAVAKTPLFEAPLSGPVYLRSSSHRLPDLVAALRGPASQPVEVDLDGSIDSVHRGIRSTFEVVPDAPVSEFRLTMQGGKKGLLQNSADLCAKVNRATAKFTAQNGKVLTLHPKLQSACAKHRRARRKH
jgi:hypothetical protein